MGALGHFHQPLVLNLPLRPSPTFPPATRMVVGNRRPLGKRLASPMAATNLPPLSPLTEFPHLAPPLRDLVLDLLSDVESHVGPQLLPSTVPADVLSFSSPAGASFGALDIRSGGPCSSVDVMVNAWLHCATPTGALDITTIFAFLNTSTDAPHFLMEFVQSSPTSLILFMDLLPRKDLVLRSEYLDEFYEKTGLEKQQREMETVPQVLRHRASSLHIRSLLSPTAVAISINCGAEGEGAMEEIMRGTMTAVSKDIVRIWLDTCASSSKQLDEEERNYLIKRDNLIKQKAIEIDFAANLPRLFGTDVSNRIVEEIQKAFKI